MDPGPFYSLTVVSCDRSLAIQTLAGALLGFGVLLLRHSVKVVGLSLLLSACQSGPAADPLPEDWTAPGLVAVDPGPPVGAESAPAPIWASATELVFLRSGQRAELTSEIADDGRLALVLPGKGGRQWFDRDLAELGNESTDGETWVRFEPGDPWLHFPLWKGKSWSAHYLLRSSRGRVAPIEVRYHCDQIEEITTPAGSFRSFRVWRRSRVAGVAQSKERTSLYWYAPEVGFVVRRLDDGQLVELIEFRRPAGD